MFCCAFSRTLDDTLELFYASTQLPIAAVREEGAHLCRGSCHCFNLPALSMEHSPEGEFATFSESGERANLFLLPICPCGKKSGVFVLGPYLAEPRLESTLTYRPAEVLPYLINLLRNLQGILMNVETCKEDDHAFCLQIRRALNVIHQDYDREIGLKSIAEELDLNKSYLSTLFKSETGQTITEYVNEIRVQSSKKLLLQTSASILDIAIQVGFSSQAYFGRTFKKLTGVTPSEFRKQNSQLV